MLNVPSLTKLECWSILLAMIIVILPTNWNYFRCSPSYIRIERQSNKNDRIVESVQWLFLKQLGEQTKDTRTYICISPSTHVTLPHFKFQMLKIPCYKLMIPQFDPQVWVRSQQDAKQMKIILNITRWPLSISHKASPQEAKIKLIGKNRNKIKLEPPVTSLFEVFLAYHDPPWYSGRWCIN